MANVKAYLDLLAAAAAATPEATLIQTEDLLAEAYQPPDPRAQDSPVEILTVHAAKGLEYDYVYLPHLDWEPLKTAKHDAPFLMEEVSGTGNAVFALNRPYTQKEQSVLYQNSQNYGQPKGPGGSPAAVLRGRHPGQKTPADVGGGEAEQGRGLAVPPQQPPGLAAAALCATAPLTSER